MRTGPFLGQPAPFAPASIPLPSSLQLWIVDHRAMSDRGTKPGTPLHWGGFCWVSFQAYFPILCTFRDGTKPNLPTPARGGGPPPIRPLGLRFRLRPLYLPDLACLEDGTEATRKPSKLLRSAGTTPAVSTGTSVALLVTASCLPPPTRDVGASLFAGVQAFF